jgi:hypothetical protein
MAAAAVVISIGGLWSASCGIMAQPLPPPDGPPVPPSGDRIVAYTWDPVTVTADRLVYAIKVDRRRYDVRQVAAQLRAMPPGHRAIRLWKWADPDLTRHPADTCRLPDGTPTVFWYPRPSAGLELVRSRWQAFLAELHRTGAPLDEVIIDFERGYGMGNLDPDRRRRHLAAIQADPRFAGVASADGRGLDTLDRAAEGYQQEDLLLWRAAMCKVVDDALQEAIYEPLRLLYPNARCSNYNSARIRRELAIPWYSGVVLWSDSAGFATHDTIAVYGNLKAVTKLRLRDGKPLGRSPYAGLLYSIKRVESVSRSSTRPLKAWVAPRDKPIPGGSLLTGSRYHDELLRHLIVRRHGLIFWNAKYGADHDLMLDINAILTECARRIGETGPSLPHVTTWNTAVIRSTTHRGGQVVHRFTLEHPHAGLRFRVNGVEHVRYPEAGEVGVWVTHTRGDDFHVVE